VVGDEDLGSVSRQPTIDLWISSDDLIISKVELSCDVYEGFVLAGFNMLYRSDY
jgi:hypothetical protein